MTDSLKKTKDTILKEFEKNHKEYFSIKSLDCKKCNHNKESHYWNGGENNANSGYDACRECGCIDYEMDDFVTKIIGYEKKYIQLKTFLSTSLDEIVRVAYREGVESCKTATDAVRIAYIVGYNVDCIQCGLKDKVLGAALNELTDKS